MTSPFPGGGRRFRRDPRGGVADEFALVAPMLLVLIISTLQVGVSFYYSSIVQAGAFALARAIENGGAGAPTSVASARAIVVKAAGLGDAAKLGLVVEVAPVTPSAPSTQAPTRDCFAAPAAKSPSIVRVTIDRPQFTTPAFFGNLWPLLFGDHVDYTVVAVPQANWAGGAGGGTCS